ncbi:SET domain-containing protein [Thermochromatium tepidum]|uniref:SET domain-containing protein-lysine N-methyltransferase n=1 Tax=Thermochromatium tepidum ATCC 43061 TaxID=316276 RepID=A0A6I6DVP1_THETI|nr:SET domain-containing protein [Thermochromatium tepidum]QGU31624.1 SET domain-containing protein-lysine N-methyltransferase [Thermochromatium tepidum ATCC 43061]
MRRRFGAETLEHRLRVAPSPIHGQGCFARIAFEPGDHIGTFEGLEVTEDGPHVLWVYDPERGRLTGRRGTNVLRWLNHSDDPNAEFDGFELYARRAIAVGSEITIDYGAGSPS